jgi:hypothetical protein
MAGGNVFAWPRIIATVAVGLMVFNGICGLINAR